MSWFGVDLSEHNRSINWSKLSKSVDFVILRVGWVGNKNNHTLDTTFEENYKNAKASGMKVGAYVYMYSNSEATAEAGAAWTIAQLRGKDLDLPVYCDMEDKSIARLGKERLSNITMAFNRAIENAGYYAGIYANLNWFNNYLNADIPKRFTSWIAHYTSGTDKYKGQFDMWQNSSSGSVDGVKRRVDTNYLYTDLFTKIENMKNKNNSTSSTENKTESSNSNKGSAKKVYRSPFKASSRQTTAFKKKGNWAAGYHTGVDRVCDSDTTLVSPANGTIQRNSYDKSYGNYVVITTSDGRSILMAHMKARSSVKLGSSIKKGDTIGIMGNTGNSYGAHLHIEVENSKTWGYNRNLLNPNDYINWNDFSKSKPSTPSKSYVSPVTWKNGLTKENVFKVSNLSDKIGVLSRKESAKCYGKSGSGYVIVYNLDGTSKHKAGFVKYAGGVKSAPTGGKTWKNGSTEEVVYADTSKREVIGSLNPKESCKCLSKIDGMYLVLYKITGTNNYKCGFVKYAGGIK